jgi:type II secretory pathway pseudopilin PulG
LSSKKERPLLFGDREDVLLHSVKQTPPGTDRAAGLKRTFVFILAMLAVAATVVSLLGYSNRGRVERNRMRLMTIRMALESYSAGTKRYPDSLEMLVPEYIRSEQWALVRYQKGGSDDSYDWLYFGGSNRAPSNLDIIVASPTWDLDHRGERYRWIIRGDGMSDSVSEEEFQVFRTRTVRRQ